MSSSQPGRRFRFERAHAGAVPTRTPGIDDRGSVARRTRRHPLRRQGRIRRGCAAGRAGRMAADQARSELRRGTADPDHPDIAGSCGTQVHSLRDLRGLCASASSPGKAARIQAAAVARILYAYRQGHAGCCARAAARECLELSSSCTTRRAMGTEEGAGDRRFQGAGDQLHRGSRAVRDSSRAHRRYGPGAVRVAHRHEHPQSHSSDRSVGGR